MAFTNHDRQESKEQVVILTAARTLPTSGSEPSRERLDTAKRASITLFASKLEGKAWLGSEILFAKQLPNMSMLRVRSLVI